MHRRGEKTDESRSSSLARKWHVGVERQPPDPPIANNPGHSRKGGSWQALLRHRLPQSPAHHEAFPAGSCCNAKARAACRGFRPRSRQSPLLPMIATGQDGRPHLTMTEFAVGHRFLRRFIALNTRLKPLRLQQLSCLGGENSANNRLCAPPSLLKRVVRAPPRDHSWLQ